MKAGTIASMILVFSIAAAATGAAVFAAWAWQVEPAPLPARWWVMAAVVASVGAVVLIPIGVLMDRALASLRQYIEDGTKVSTVMSGGLRWFRPITRAFIGAVDQFQQREQALRNQLGELEIRHRVSEAERRQIEAVLHALRDGVLVTDAFNEIVMANQAAATILGFDLKTAIHKSIDVVIADQRLRQLIRDARETGSVTDSRHVELAIDQGHGKRDQASSGSRAMPLGAPTPKLAPTALNSSARVHEVTLGCVGNHKHEVAGVVTILHDLTREREVSQMKSDFVSKASHELRTPLSSIRGYVEMLVDGEAGDEQGRKEFYRVIQSETERLGRLIDNMLNISRIEAGIVQIEREQVDLRALIHRAVSTIEPQAREKGITISTRLAPPEADLSVEGDGDMLYQVVLNLLSNAVKYCPGGQGGQGGQGLGAGDQGSLRGGATDPQSLIPIPCSASSTRITVTADTDNLTRCVLVGVSDTGLGIPPDALPKLFDKFFRVENYKRIAKGTGLGLSLCKHIVETVHQGQIGVESKLGMGSRFWFSVPMKYVGASPRQAAA